MDDRGDYNSSPCTSYRRANKLNQLAVIENFRQPKILFLQKTKLDISLKFSSSGETFNEMFSFSYWEILFVCVGVLRPSQPNGVMSSTVSLPNHTFTRQAESSKPLTSIVHILSPETDNCPTRI